MPIKTNKSIFYHIPKTGGSWVKTALRKSMGTNDDFMFVRPKPNYDRIDDSVYWQHKLAGLFPLRRGHLAACGLKEKDKEGLFSYTFVRRHLDWYRSWWVNKTYTINKLRKWKTFLLDYAYDPNFEQFITNVINMFPSGALTTIYQCYLGRDGNDLDFVGTQENLVEDLIKALTLAGEDFDEDVIRNLGKVNTSASRKLSTDLPISPKLEKKLNTREKWITKTFYDG